MLQHNKHEIPLKNIGIHGKIPQMYHVKSAFLFFIYSLFSFFFLPAMTVFVKSQVYGLSLYF